MTNALQELLEKIDKHNLSIKDILWIKIALYDDMEHITSSLAINNNNKEISTKLTNTLSSFNYDSGYAAIGIQEDSIIMFKDNTWLERNEYDGSEWWEFKSIPKFKLTKEK